MITVLAVLATVVVAAAVGIALARSVARRIARVVTLIEPAAIDNESNLPQAIDHLERIVGEGLAARDERSRAAERLSAALDSIPQGVVVFDGEGLPVFHNRAGSQYSSARHGEALVVAAMDDLLARALAGETCVDTVELYGPPRRFMVITAVPFDPATSAPGAVAVIDDVTERRRLEAVRRDFVSNISHELKTPVGALALLAETLIDEPDHEAASRLAQRMYKEAHRVARTIDDLLELSRIEAEESPHRESIAVADLLDDAVERMRPAAEQKQIGLDLRRPDSRLVVVGDGRQLVSAVFNLLENAVKYSDAGSVVEVWATTDGETVDVSVRDHGMGIPSRDLDRVFERFYRVDQARSRHTGGTGLGLAIVRHVVNNHGGAVLLDSVEGQGSTFTLRLPAGADPALMSNYEVG